MEATDNPRDWMEGHGDLEPGPSVNTTSETSTKKIILVGSQVLGENGL
jgi:hypothetical protein